MTKRSRMVKSLCSLMPFFVGLDPAEWELVAITTFSLLLMRDVIYWSIYLLILFDGGFSSLLVQNREWCIKSDTLNGWSLNSSLKATAWRLINSVVDRPLIQTKICSQKVIQKTASKQPKPIKCVNPRRIKDLTSKQIFHAQINHEMIKLS